MLHDTHLPMFGFICIAFLLVCVVLAIATWILVKSGEQGKTKMNGAAGCAIGFALLVIAGLMALGSFFVVLVSGGREVVREVQRNGGWDWHYDSKEPSREHERGGDSSGEHTPTPAPPPAPSDRARDGELEVVFELGAAGGIGPIMEHVRDLAPGGISSSLAVSAENGAEHSRLTVRFEVADDERDALRRRIEETWPDSKLPDGGSLSIEPARD